MASRAARTRTSTTRACSGPCSTSPAPESATKSSNRPLGPELTCQPTPMFPSTPSKPFRMRSRFRMATAEVTLRGRTLTSFQARFHRTLARRRQRLTRHRQLIRRRRPIRRLHLIHRPASSQPAIRTLARLQLRDLSRDRARSKFTSQRRVRQAESIEITRSRPARRLCPVAVHRRSRHLLLLGQIRTKRTTSSSDYCRQRKAASSVRHHQHRRVLRWFTSLHRRRRPFTSIQLIRHKFTTRHRRIQRKALQLTRVLSIHRRFKALQLTRRKFKALQLTQRKFQLTQRSLHSLRTYKTLRLIHRLSTLRTFRALQSIRRLQYSIQGRRICQPPKNNRLDLSQCQQSRLVHLTQCIRPPTATLWTPSSRTPATAGSTASRLAPPCALTSRT